MLVSFEKCTKINKEDSYFFKQALTKKLTHSFLSVKIDSAEVTKINKRNC